MAEWTAEAALAKARELSREPGSVRPYWHERLQTARHGRGYAFLDAVGYLLVTADGHAYGLLTEPIGDVIDEHLAKAAHRNRTLSLEELGAPQRLAVAAHDAGTGIPDEADTDYARYLLIRMRRARPGITGLALLAHDDSLLLPPEPGRRYTHACPFCGQPAVHQDRYPRSVCDTCHDRTTDRHGRPISGSNTHLSGGFVAHFVDPPGEVCDEVTRTHRCFVDGRPATIGEARFGGIVVEALDEDVAH